MVVTVQHDIDAAHAAAQCVVRTHEQLVDYLRPGLTLTQIDQKIADILKDLDCKSSFLHYRIPGHPPFKSHSCLSLNDCIVHGEHVMTDKPIQPGDILSVDIGVNHHGWIGDAAWTYGIESVTPQALTLMQCGRESLKRGIEAIKPGRPLVDWARAVQNYVEKECGFHLVRGLGGHGYGKKLHGPPFVANVVPKTPNEWGDAWTAFKPGMLLALEPMLAVGTGYTKASHGKWPIFTADGSLAVHYEADVMITSDGPRNLTEGIDQLPDIVG